MPKKNLKILFASAELAPLVKVGGLADVVGSLPEALASLGCEVRMIIPKYGVIDEKKFKLKKIFNNIEVLSGNKKELINIYETNLPGKRIKVYLIDYPKYFGDKEKVYHGNSSEKYLFFSQAVLSAVKTISYIPDLMHCHDFHTALIPALLKINAKNNPSCTLAPTKSLYTIHNLNYQGKSEIECLSTANLTKSSLKSLEIDAQDGDINFMVQGIVNANWVNTVSPTYAREIGTSVYGAGLERVIQTNKRKISGILNGIDVDLYNPATDKAIINYSLKNLSKKVENKLALQKTLKLPVDANIPLVGFISRLAWQKGVELFSQDLIQNTKCQFVFLGTGDKKYEAHLSKLAKKFPDKMSAQIMFDVRLAQKIYAASDIFAIPSRFEPCGLTQMIAMRYGTVPVVRDTGGLHDSVNAQLGFCFKDFSSEALQDAFTKALNIYYQKKDKWQVLQKNGMRADWSWKKSAQEYLKIYQKVCK